MNRALQSIGSVPFSQVLAQAAAKQSALESVAVGRGTKQLCCQLTILAAAGMLQVPFVGSPNAYSDESVSETIADRSSRMLEAARRLEAALLSSSALSAAELKRLRREAAMIVHPDLCPEEHKRVGEELMKSVNLLVAAALDSRPQP